MLDEPIKAFGSYQVKAKLGFEVNGTVYVSVFEENKGVPLFGAHSGGEEWAAIAAVGAPAPAGCAPAFWPAKESAAPGGREKALGALWYNGPSRFPNPNRWTLFTAR